MQTVPWCAVKHYAVSAEMQETHPLQCGTHVHAHLERSMTLESVNIRHTMDGAYKGPLENSSIAH
jgi:hypothetical protein